MGVAVSSSASVSSSRSVPVASGEVPVEEKIPQKGDLSVYSASKAVTFVASVYADDSACTANTCTINGASL